MNGSMSWGNCVLLVLALVGLTLAGCVAPAEGQGSIAFYVKDGPADEFASIFVTFSLVEVHRAGSSSANATNASADENATAVDGNETLGGAGWFTVVNATQTIDLKAFAGDAKAFLGDANVTAGKYTQIRIAIDEAYGVSVDGNRTNITVPSSTLRIVRPWTVEAGMETQLVVDFDLDRSLHEAGKSGKWMFKPVIKLLVDGPESANASGSEAREGTQARGGRPDDVGSKGEDAGSQGRRPA